MCIATLSLDDTVTTLYRRACPILVLDACALLDIIRIPSRVDSHTECSRILNSVTSILRDAESEKMTILLPPPVLLEWEMRALETRDNTENEIKKFQLNLDVVRCISEFHGTPLPNVPLPSNELAEYLYALSERFINASINLEEDSTLSSEILSRVTHCIAPATKGASPSDCKLYEHTLGIIRKLRGNGFARPIALLSSNKKDFFQDGKPKSPIDSELGAISGSLCSTWYWAESVLA